MNFDLIMTGKELKSLRLKANLTQQELANKLGTFKSIISQWENEKHRISRLYIEKIKQVIK